MAVSGGFSRNSGNRSRAGFRLRSELDGQLFRSHAIRNHRNRVNRSPAGMVIRSASDRYTINGAFSRTRVSTLFRAREGCESRTGITSFGRARLATVGAPRNPRPGHRFACSGGRQLVKRAPADRSFEISPVCLVSALTRADPQSVRAVSTNAIGTRGTPGSTAISAWDHLRHP